MLHAILSQKEAKKKPLFCEPRRSVFPEIKRESSKLARSSFDVTSKLKRKLESKPSFLRLPRRGLYHINVYVQIDCV